MNERTFYDIKVMIFGPVIYRFNKLLMKIKFKLKVYREVRGFNPEYIYNNSGMYAILFKWDWVLSHRVLDVIAYVRENPSTINCWAYWNSKGYPFQKELN